MADRKPWVLASNNAKKMRELSQILQTFSIELVTPRDAAIALDVDEWGTTFAQNATLKALAFARAYGGVAIADDSGLSVDGLGGAPGVYSARYSGENATDEANNAKLVAELASRPDASRRCRYYAVIAVARPVSAESLVLPEVTPVNPLASKDAFLALEPFGAYRLPAAFSASLGGPAEDTELWLFEGTMEGEIALEPRGEGGFGYDPYVRLEDGRHVAELPDEEKNGRSHRAMALQAMYIAMV